MSVTIRYLRSYEPKCISNHLRWFAGYCQL